MYAKPRTSFAKWGRIKVMIRIYSIEKARLMYKIDKKITLF